VAAKDGHFVEPAFQYLDDTFALPLCIGFSLAKA
jgi:hypothetical protein